MFQRNAGVCRLVVSSLALVFLLTNSHAGTVVDADGDGIDDTMDNCPFFANPAQTDTDSDGAGDKCDICPNGVDLDTDGDAICDSLDTCPGSDDGVDSDGDGRPDGCDNCPLIANNGQIDVDGDGIGDACDICTDIDGDGVGDAGFANTCLSPDNCRFAANPTQTDTDADSLGDACDTSAAGAPVTSVILGEARNIKKRKTTYFGSSGSRPKATGIESDAQWIMPKAGALSNLFVRLSKNASHAAGGSYTFTVRVNGASPAGTPTCTITGATSSCSDTTHSVTFAAGDLVAIQATPSAPEQPTDNLDVRWAASL